MIYDYDQWSLISHTSSNFLDQRGTNFLFLLCNKRKASLELDLVRRYCKKKKTQTFFFLHATFFLPHRLSQESLNVQKGPFFLPPTI